VGSNPTLPATSPEIRFMSDSVRAAVYGFPSFDVVDVPGGAVQVSPLVVGATDLADWPKVRWTRS
jgi:hypothetical protein